MASSSFRSGGALRKCQRDSPRRWPELLTHRRLWQIMNSNQNPLAQNISIEPVKYQGLTHILVRELVHYDPLTGIFIDKVGNGSRKAGSEIKSSHSEGYIKVSLLGRQLMAHRLAIFYMTGQLPPEDVDHINGIRNCNIYSNLRCVSRSVNMQNLREPKSDKRGRTSQYLGVSWAKDKKRWVAGIKIPKGKRISLGYFESELDAHNAYLDMKKKIHEGNTL